MATNYALILRVLFDVIMEFAQKAGKTREELDAMYESSKAEYDELPDPSTLDDTVLR